MAILYCDKHNYMYNSEKGCPYCKEITPLEKRSCNTCIYKEDCILGAECSNEGYQYYVSKLG